MNALSAACALLLAVAHASAAPAPLAHVRSVEGEATLKREGGAAYEAVAVGTALAKGDLLATDVDSQVVLKLQGGGEVRVYELTQVKITDEFVKSDVRQLQLFLRTGSVKTDAPAETLQSGGFSVKTPASTSSIRGTEFTVAHYDGFGTEVIYTRGSGDTLGLDGRRMLQVAGQLVRLDIASTLSGPLVESVLRVGLDYGAAGGRSAAETAASQNRQPLAGQPPGDASDPQRLLANLGPNLGFIPRIRVIFDIASTP